MKKHLKEISGLLNDHDFSKNSDKTDFLIRETTTYRKYTA